MLLEPISPALGAHLTGFKLLPASISSKQFCLRGNFDKHRFHARRCFTYPPAVNDEVSLKYHDRDVQALLVLSLMELEPSCFRTKGTLLLSLAEKFRFTVMLSQAFRRQAQSHA